MKSFRDLPVATKLVGSTIIVFLLSFLTLAFLYSRGAENAVLRQAYAGLDALRATRSPNIQQYFDRMDRRLELAAEADWSRDMLARGPAAFRNNRREYDRLRAPVDDVAERMSAALGAFDMMFVDATGTILYTSLQQADNGTNLRTGPYRDTPLAAVFERTVAPNAPRAVQHADYQDYAPAGGAPTAFIATRVVSSDSTLLGAVVFKLPVTEINAVMAIREGLGETGENYLVGPDSLMRTDSRFGTERTILRQKVVTPAALRALSGESGSLIQQGYRGVEVLAVHAPINVLGTTWANVVVVDRAEILQPVVALRNRMALIGLVVFLVSGALIVWLLRTIVLSPLATLSHGARRVQQGSYGEDVPVRGGDEMGQLGTAFNSMVASVRSRENEMKELGSRLTAILDTSPVGVGVSVEGVVRFANPSFTELVGLGLGDEMPRMYRNPKDREVVLARLAAEGIVRDHELKVVNKDGRERDLLVTYLKTEFEGQPGILGWLVDVTLIKETEKELKLAHFLADSALDLTRSGYWHIEFADEGHYRASPRAQEIFGEPRRADGRYNLMEEWLARIVAVDPAEAEATGRLYQGALDGTYKRYDATYPYKRPEDGRVVWLRALGSMERHADGRPKTMYGVVQDITAMKEAEQQLQMSEQRLEAAAFGANIGLWEVDPVKGAIYVNEILESQLGYAAGGLRENNEKWAPLRGGLAAWPEYIHPDDRPFTLEQIGLHLSGKTNVYKVAHRVRGPDGAYKWILSVGQSVERDAAGNSLRVNGVHIDISEMKALQQELEKARDAAEVAAQAKADFLANMSHEIRTPMNAVIGLAHLAQLTNLDRKQRDYVRKIESSGKHLLGIINDILDYSKIEAGKLTVETVDFDLDRLLENVAALVGDKAAVKGLEVTFDVQPDVPRALMGDPLRIGQILINYANNAVKFTETGEVIVRVRALEVTDADALLRFEVKDTGIGLTEAQRAKLFQSFQQADASTSRKYGGTGLGLAISKNLADLMGGDVGCESVYGSGSTFWMTVRLPRGRATDKRLIVPPQFRNARLLVVDDSETAREVLRVMLEQMSFRVDEARSGEAALSKVTEADERGDPYKIVCLDWRMPPGIDGIETARRMATIHLSEVPHRLLVTAHGRPEVLQAAENAGLAATVTKPVSPSLLFDALIEMLGGKLEERAGDHKAADVDAVKGARVLLVEDNELNQQVATELLESVGYVVDLAVNGEQAVKRVNEQQYDAVLMDMHMPVMDGEKATRIIRTTDRHGKLPIIALTANAMEDDLRKCLAAGMNDRITKPIEPAELYTKLAKWIVPGARDVAARSDAPRATDAPELDLSGIEGLNVDAALKRLMGKRALYDSILQKFAFGEMADSAGTVERQLKSKDREAAQRTAHSLKGAAGTLGATELESRARALEDGIKSNKPAKDVEKMRKSVAEELSRLVGALRATLGNGNGAATTAANTSALSPADMDRMRAALNAGDLGELEDIARSLGGAHPDASRLLVDLCKAFDYDGLARHLEKQ